MLVTLDSGISLLGHLACKQTLCTYKAYLVCQYQSSLYLVTFIFVQFQKLSIPPPQWDFHVRTPVLPVIFIFYHKNNPLFPFGISTSITCNLDTLWKIGFGKKNVLKLKKTLQTLIVCTAHCCCLFLIDHNILRYTQRKNTTIYER